MPLLVTKIVPSESAGAMRGENVAPPFSPADMLRYCAIPGTQVYLLGAGQRRVTIKSQQIRALNLVWALHNDGRLPSDRLAIVGGGFAGLTAAAAAMRLGSRVTLFEREYQCLSIQARCDHRRIHPNVFDWPETGSQNDTADLPLLSWRAGSAASVAAAVWAAWKAEFHARAAVRTQTTVDSISTDGTIAHREKGAGAISTPETYDVVIAAAGMGLDAHPPSKSYWDPDELERYIQTEDRDKRSVVIIGNGDGGVTDALRAAIGAVEHEDLKLQEWMERELLPRVPPSLKHDVGVLERELSRHHDIAEASNFLGRRYAELLHGDMGALRKAVEPRLRKETLVSLYGLTPTPYSTDATALNRFMLALVLHFDPHRDHLRYMIGDRNIEPPQLPGELRVVRKGPHGVVRRLFTSEVLDLVEHMPKDFDAPRIALYRMDYFDHGVAPPMVPPYPDPRGLFYVPLSTSDYDRFASLQYLDEGMRRRGPLGFGHYACRSPEAAVAIGRNHLGLRVDVQPAEVALPDDPARQQTWNTILHDDTFPAEWNYDRWVTDKHVPHDAVHGVIDEEVVYCFHESRIGRPWRGGMP